MSPLCNENDSQHSINHTEASGFCSLASTGAGGCACPGNECPDNRIDMM